MTNMWFQTSKFLLALCGCVLYLCGTCQIPVNIPNLVPASPNAASIGKYGEVPVGKYTGIPDISVPIYTIKSGSLTLPLSLSYHAGGIKIPEMASNVGLGWSLRAGGTITRTVMGIDDLEPEIGYMNQTVPLSTKIQEWTHPDHRLTMAKVAANFYDGEPDVYNFSFGQWSGSFVFHQGTGEFLCTPYSKLRIHTVISNNSINQFEITTPDGILYTFGAVEYTEKVMYASGVGLTKLVPTSWSVTDIIDLKDGSAISFHYVPFEVYLTNLAFEAKLERIDGITGPHIQTISSSQGLYQADYDRMINQRINYIDFKGGRVNFIYDPLQRCDLPGDFALKEVKVSNISKAVSKIVLFQSYFYDNPDDRVCTVNSRDKQRLKLDSVRSESVNDNKFLPAYKFKYNGNNFFPSRLSYEQDEFGYWGDNFGTNNTLIPSATYQDQYFHGNSRSVNSEKAKTGLLCEIVYPTGGKTIFEYEGNSYLNTDIQNATQNVGATFAVETAYNFACEELALKPNPQAEFHVEGPASKLVFVSYGGYDTREFLEATGQQAPTFSPFLYDKNDPAKANLLYTQYFESKPYSITDRLYLMPGTYVVGANMGISEDCNANHIIGNVYGSMNISATYTKQTQTTTYVNKLSGGLRIKQITSYPDSRTAPLITRYSYIDDAGWSTGGSQYKSSYAYPGVDYRQNEVQDPGTFYIYYKRTSISNYPLIYTHGSPVGYSRVIEEKCDSSGLSLGKTISWFTSFFDYSDIMDDGYPFAPPNKKDWKRGMLKREAKFARSEGNNFVMVSDLENIYAELENLTVTEGTSGVKVGYNVDMGLAENVVFEGQRTQDPYTIYDDIMFPMMITPYKASSGLMQLVKTVQRNYDQHDPNKLLVDSTEYTYSSNNLQPEEVSTGNSRAEQKKLKYYYPWDISSTNNALYNAFNSINAINIPIKSDEYNNGSKIKTLDANYHQLNGSLVLIKDYTESIFNASSKKIFEVTRYDNRGNIIESIDKDGVRSAFIPGYENDVYISTVRNASVDAIAYTSFETSGSGGWTQSGLVLSGGGITGNRSFHGTLAKNVPSGDYIVTAWTDANSALTVNGQTGSVLSSVNSWKLVKWQFSGISSIVVDGGKMDEVRLHPADAEMQTYTYEPLIGITSSCDKNNHITSFAYDLFGRLILITDVSGNILKKFDYSYSIQSDNYVVYGNSFKSVEFRKNICPENYTGSLVSYIVNANSYYAATQQEADSLADADITANGQAYANEHGQCSLLSFSNVAISRDFYSIYCTQPYQPIPYHVNVPAGNFTSYISQEDADNKAISFAQEEANLHGQCLELVSVYFSSENPHAYNFVVYITNETTGEFTITYGEPGAKLIGNFPPGQYRISVMPIEPRYLLYDFYVGCVSYNGEYFGEQEVEISASCPNIIIY